MWEVAQENELLENISKVNLNVNFDRCTCSREYGGDFFIRVAYVYLQQNNIAPI